MNKPLLILSLLITCFWVKAQAFTDKNLSPAVLQINTSKTANEYDTLFNKFSNAKSAENWPAYYYAAVTLYLKNDLLLKKNEVQNTDEANALARKLATAASTLQRDNTEITTLIGLLYFQKLQMDKSQDAQQDLQTILKIVAKAEGNDNPRLTILKGKLKEKSGDKAGAELLYQKASIALEGQNSIDATTPTWGKQLLP